MTINNLEVPTTGKNEKDNLQAVVESTKRNIGEVAMDLVESDHPKNEPLQIWIDRNPDNELWYNENIGINFKLVDGGRVELLGDIFRVEDEVVEPNREDVWVLNNRSLFTKKGRENYSKGKRLPNWEKYLNFLPGDDLNKLKFLQEILGLNFSGYCNSSNGMMFNSGIVGYYHGISNLEMGIKFMEVGNDCHNNAFSLRLLDN